MKQTIIRTINLVLIIGILGVYQQYAAEREIIVMAHAEEEKAAKALEKEYRKMIEEAEEKASQKAYRDGVYEGTGEGYGGEISLKIIVEDGEIASVDLVSAEKEDTLYLNLAKELLGQIVEAQNADMDGISGATYSSKGILSAASQALKEAKLNE